MATEFKHIVRIADTDLEGKKKVPYALAKIKGIGIRLGQIICRLAKIDMNKRLGELSEEEIQRIEETIKNLPKLVPPWLLNRPRDPFTGENMHKVAGDWDLTVKMDIEFLKTIKCWRGLRHAWGLPVRGQRTRTCFRKGRTVGVMRRAKGPRAHGSKQQEQKKK